ncbi:hypothetical protein QTO34_017205 [Cnephaeus nilssonii]|uniref:RAD9-HUS1-RAD1 interacting nuclear orphan 1 n=1 Tax=Cnephaeus nilssonii TaxID=3371016 RepID=A0AA40I0J8_CNENI|nr:hypothetical protein QTO34_017205 [Eptesicus nilssonii]
MPPRKKRRQTSQKAQLLFHQQPLEGPKHCYRSPQLPITHTRQVPSKPIDHNTITSWVLGSMTGIFVLLPPAHPLLGIEPEIWAWGPGIEPATEVLSTLTFESPQSSSSSATLGGPLIQQCPNHSVKDISETPLVPMLSPPSCGEMSAHALQDLPYMFIAPDIQTPESSSVKQGLLPPDQKENSLPSCSLHTSTPESPEPGPVLVKDTPEEKYGVKVTWRRRRHLFTYLRERGKLSKSQFLVKN